MIRSWLARRRRPRVYYTLLVGLAISAAGCWGNGRVAPARGQVDITIDPAMVRGAANAPVTIVEFSDYQ